MRTWAKKKKKKKVWCLLVHEFSDRGQTVSSRPVLWTPVPRACRGEHAQEQGLNVVSTSGLLWALCSARAWTRQSVLCTVCVLENWKWSGRSLDTVSCSFILCPFDYGHSPACILPGNGSSWTGTYHHGLQMVNPLPSLVWAGEDSALRNTWICPVSSQALKPDWQSPKSDHLLAPLDLPSSWLVMPLLRPTVNYLRYLRYLPEGSS